MTTATIESPLGISYPDTDFGRWLKATADLKREWLAEEYETSLADIMRKREGRVKVNHETETQRAKARMLAKGIVTKRLYWLAEAPDGTPNPLRNDPEWGWGESTPEDKAVEEEAAKGLKELAEWLEEQTWSEFAVSLAKQYRSKGSLSPKQIAAGKSMQAKVTASRERKAKEQAEAKVTALDIDALPSGMYAVPGGDTRLKLRVSRSTRETSFPKGTIFVNDDAAYGQRQLYGFQKPGKDYRGKVAEALAAVVANPYEARIAYGRLVGKCGSCNARLENPDSIAAGIGPICAQKWEG
jgi:hypothetical protein